MFPSTHGFSVVALFAGLTFMIQGLWAPSLARGDGEGHYSFFKGPALTFYVCDNEYSYVGSPEGNFREMQGFCYYDAFGDINQFIRYGWSPMMYTLQYTSVTGGSWITVTGNYIYWIWNDDDPKHALDGSIYTREPGDQDRGDPPDWLRRQLGLEPAAQELGPE